MADPDPSTEELIERAQQGNGDAGQELLARHRPRLRKLIGFRMDPRLAGRFDPSDIVQEALLKAARKLPAYLQNRPLPFYVWLSRLARGHLAKVHKKHLAHKRDIAREEPGILNLPDESIVELASRLLSTGSNPSNRLQRQELSARVHQALAQLRPRDRKVLVLRYLDQLSTKETAAELEISEAAVKLRALRAVQRLRAHLGDLLEDGP
jgi:RNA polymerase sigma-70 factor (ECF subfamily)